jgi:Transposase C of IS166 homeodomain
MCRELLIEKLRLMIKKLRREQFGQSSERAAAAVNVLIAPTIDLARSGARQSAYADCGRGGRAA